MDNPALGQRMHSYGVVLHGKLDEMRWMEFLNAVATAIGMEPVGEPKVWTYPLDGKGGSGQTMLLPITESFLALDTWSDHSGAYLFVCSCRPYGIIAIDICAGSFGLKPQKGSHGRFYNELRLK